MRDEISKRTAQSELSGLYGALGAAIRAMDKYGPGTGPSQRYGFSPESDAATVRALTTEMARLRVLLVEKFGDEVTELTKNINQLLESFGAATNEDERVKFGADIYNVVVELSGNIKNELDGGIYR